MDYEAYVAGVEGVTPADSRIIHTGSYQLGAEHRSKDVRFTENQYERFVRAYSDYLDGRNAKTVTSETSLLVYRIGVEESKSDADIPVKDLVGFYRLINPVVDDSTPPGTTDHPESSTGAKREKLNNLPYDLVPFQEITDAFTRVAEYGAKKYEPWNWSKGLSRVQLIGSLLRHTFAYLRGQDYDDGPKGSGLLHTDHILWNAAALTHNVHHELEDGRRPEPPRDYKK